ncbi:hypothetical protein [Bradyrhizobium quebecense]|uniref:Uncharacterized protein n=2 Tax=Bradyrhizobium quebecense TaxID=2748629 RepID=A0ABS3M8S0_9BRAD|nr:hypothetical protein [Bradyrhizobium quebecense]UGY03267.1 hypothetical protein J4P68_0000345 [Bradyrhizobium quebecense]
MSKYTIDQLRTAIRELKIPTPLSDQLPLPADQVSTRDQWLGWLNEYLGPGYYNRQTFVDDACHVYQHLNNGRMIVWLNEAAGEDPRIVQAAIVAMDGREPAQTEAMYARRILPWEDLARRLFGVR